MPLPCDFGEAPAVCRADGSWLHDGPVPVSEMKEKPAIRDIPDEDPGNFHTPGGFVLTPLERIPRKGEFFEYASRRFEVRDVDNKNLGEVLASPIGKPTDSYV